MVVDFERLNNLSINMLWNELISNYKKYSVILKYALMDLNSSLYRQQFDKKSIEFDYYLAKNVLTLLVNIIKCKSKQPNEKTFNEINHHFIANLIDWGFLLNFYSIIQQFNDFTETRSVCDVIAAYVISNKKMVEEINLITNKIKDLIDEMESVIVMNLMDEIRLKNMDYLIDMSLNIQNLIELMPQFIDLVDIIPFFNCFIKIIEVLIPAIKNQMPVKDPLISQTFFRKLNVLEWKSLQILNHILLLLSRTNDSEKQSTFEYLLMLISMEKRTCFLMDNLFKINENYTIKIKDGDLLSQIMNNIQQNLIRDEETFVLIQNEKKTNDPPLIDQPIDLEIKTKIMDYVDNANSIYDDEFVDDNDCLLNYPLSNNLLNETDSDESIETINKPLMNLISNLNGSNPKTMAVNNPSTDIKESLQKTNISVSEVKKESQKKYLRKKIYHQNNAIKKGYSNKN